MHQLNWPVDVLDKFLFLHLLRFGFEVCLSSFLKFGSQKRLPLTFGLASQAKPIDSLSMSSKHCSPPPALNMAMVKVTTVVRSVLKT